MIRYAIVVLVLLDALFMWSLCVAAAIGDNES